MILIVGGAGYIGSHVNKLLTRKGHQTVVYDNLANGHRELARWGEFVQGDLADKDALHSLFSKFKFSTVMHFAALAYVRESVADPQKYYVNNVQNTLQLLGAMLEHGVRQIVFSSTCATYGVPQEIPITETHPQFPVNPYGWTKLMVERILHDYSQAYGMRHVNLRYFNAAGADPESEIGEWHVPETHLIPLALEVACQKASHINIFGDNYPTADGTCIRDYIHVNDLARAHELAMQYLESAHQDESFNLGNGRGFSIKEVIAAAEKVTGRKIKSLIAPARMGDPAILVGSSKKAYEILGWRPEFTRLADIIKTAWDWHRKL
jgi:UDP-glucose 4-epimerase